VAGELAGRRHAEGVLDPAVRVGVGRQRLPAAPEHETVGAGAAKHSQVVVVGMVLHHQHDDVLDLGNGVGARPAATGICAR
jgi:hypothetical protein